MNCGEPWCDGCAPRQLTEDEKIKRDEALADDDRERYKKEMRNLGDEYRRKYD